MNIDRPAAWAATVGKPCAAHSRAIGTHAGGTGASDGPVAATRYSVAESSSPSYGSLAVGADSRASGAITSTSLVDGGLVAACWGEGLVLVGVVGRRRPGGRGLE
jgi:hypothetical protein